MKQQLKNILSAFLLLLFLFPQAEKEIHAFDHLGEIQCTSVSKHFHPEEHHCSICDFNINESRLLNDVDYHIVLPTTHVYFSPFYSHLHAEGSISLLPARGPPAC